VRQTPAVQRASGTRVHTTQEVEMLKKVTSHFRYEQMREPANRE